MKIGYVLYKKDNMLTTIFEGGVFQQIVSPEEGFRFNLNLSQSHNMRN